MTAAERSYILGLIGRPLTAELAAKNHRSCTLVCLFSRGGPEEPSANRRRRQGLEEPVRETSVVEETEGREGEVFVTIEVQALATLLDAGGANRPCDRGEKSGKPSNNRGGLGGNRPAMRASGLVTVRVH